VEAASPFPKATNQITCGKRVEAKRKEDIIVPRQNSKRREIFTGNGDSCKKSRRRQTRPEKLDRKGRVERTKREILNQIVAARCYTTSALTKYECRVKQRARTPKRTELKCLKQSAADGQRGIGVGFNSARETKMQYQINSGTCNRIGDNRKGGETNTGEVPFQRKKSSKE